MAIELIDMLYITLIIFTSIIWTLLIIILLKLMKVLNMATEIVGVYNKVKKIILAYKHIPDILKEKASSIIKK